MTVHKLTLIKCDFDILDTFSPLLKYTIELKIFDIKFRMFEIQKWIDKLPNLKKFSIRNKSQIQEYEVANLLKFNSPELSVFLDLEHRSILFLVESIFTHLCHSNFKTLELKLNAICLSRDMFNEDKFLLSMRGDDSQSSRSNNSPVFLGHSGKSIKLTSSLQSDSPMPPEVRRKAQRHVFQVIG